MLIDTETEQQHSKYRNTAIIKATNR